ncbi:unnamed protein product, partial [Rotaria socialis]
ELVEYAWTCCNDVFDTGCAIGSLTRLMTASARGIGELLSSEQRNQVF